MKKELFLFLLTIFLFSCIENDEPPHIISTEFNHKILDGYFVVSIAFDNTGNAWAGTLEQGLIKYNPNETVIYNADNSIIPDSSMIHNIAVDHNNNVWFGCKGLFKFDGEIFTHYNTQNSDIPRDYAASIAIDSKNNVWFSSNGLVKYNNYKWDVYTPENSSLPVSSCKSIAIDKYDNVWVAQSKFVNDPYLIKISNSKWTIYTPDEMGFSPYFFGNIQFNADNQLCGSIDYSLSSAILNSGPQVFIFDGEATQKFQFDSITDINYVTTDHDNNIWCAGYNMYALYDGNNWQIDDSTFKDIGVFTIKESPDNTIWIGTGDGIYIND